MALLTDPAIQDFQAVQRNFDKISRRVFSGVGSPEGVVRAAPGALFMREDGAAGSSLYVKQTAATVATGWLAVA